MADWTPPSQAEVEGYFERLNNWGGWGAEDQRGSLNLISPEKRAATYCRQHRLAVSAGGDFLSCNATL